MKSSEAILAVGSLCRLATSQGRIRHWMEECQPKNWGMWKPAMVLSQSFFSSGHMLFGTDFPWGDTPGIIKKIKGLSIPEEEKKMILVRMQGSWLGSSEISS